MYSSNRWSKSKSGRDLISELPDDVKHMILELLPIRETARISVLSSFWNDVWLRHERLAFDKEFFDYWFTKHGSKRGAIGPDKREAVINTITNILLLRAEPVKKFTLCIHPDYKPEQSDLELWCRHLSRNGIEQLQISICNAPKLKPPFCVFSCQTIKQITLQGFRFRGPVKPHSIFPSVTSLVFDHVDFDSRMVCNIPKLEKLYFKRCFGVYNYMITAPKLRSVFFSSCTLFAHDLEWLRLYWGTIKTVSFCVYSILTSTMMTIDELEVFPTAFNLREIELDILNGRPQHYIIAMLLLRKSPNLRELDISVRIAMIYHSVFEDENDDTSYVLQHLQSYSENLDLKTLERLNIGSFGRREVETFFVKVLLSKSPALVKVVINVSEVPEGVMITKITSNLLDFPRASQKAEIILNGLNNVHA